MGGKALNKYGVFTERKSTNDFLMIGKSIRETLEYYFMVQFGIELDTHIVTCYHTKADHGDLDLLVKITPDINADYKKLIELMFLPKAINANGGVISFDYQGFQVDFIPIEVSKWETAKVYYSYDPLGNIMGKTFHKFGLSYGWDGLFYKYRNFNGKNSEDILLTNDAKAIFDFGGYDYERYLKGFDTLEDIFKFCISSRYFDAEMFQFENLKHIDKKRNRKRGSYHLFLNYLKDNNINTKFIFDSNKDNYLETIDICFPNAKLLSQLHDLDVKDAQNKALAEKFNGEVIMAWLPELKGKELGAAMDTFKKYCGDSYTQIVTDMDIESLKKLFITVYTNVHAKTK